MLKSALGIFLFFPSSFIDAQDLSINLYPAPGRYYIKLVNGKALDAAAPNVNENGCSIQIWDFHGRVNQQWDVEQVMENGQAVPGAFSIRCVASGKALDAHAPTANNNGGRIQLYDRSGAANQQWVISTVGNKWKITARPGNKVLDVSGNQIAVNGTAVQLWEYANASNQQWILEPVRSCVTLYEGTNFTGQSVELCTVGSHQQPFGTVRSIVVPPGHEISFTVDAECTGAPATYTSSLANTRIHCSSVNVVLTPATQVTNVRPQISCLPKCPSTLLRGDREFDGHGPCISVGANAEITPDGMGIQARISITAIECYDNGNPQSDFSETRAEWVCPVFQAPAGRRIRRIIDNPYSVVHFRSLPGGGQFIGPWIDPWARGVEESPTPGIYAFENNSNTAYRVSSGGWVEYFEVVGDTGGADISTDADCGDDLRLFAMRFRTLRIELE